MVETDETYLVVETGGKYVIGGFVEGGKFLVVGLVVVTTGTYLGVEAAGKYIIGGFVVLNVG